MKINVLLTLVMITGLNGASNLNNLKERPNQNIEDLLQKISDSYADFEKEQDKFLQEDADLKEAKRQSLVHTQNLPESFVGNFFDEVIKDSDATEKRSPYNFPPANLTEEQVQHSNWIEESSGLNSKLNLGDSGLNSLANNTKQHNQSLKFKIKINNKNLDQPQEKQAAIEKPKLNLSALKQQAREKEEEWETWRKKRRERIKRPVTPEIIKDDNYDEEFERFLQSLKGSKQPIILCTPDMVTTSEKNIRKVKEETSKEKPSNNSAISLMKALSEQHKKHSKYLNSLLRQEADRLGSNNKTSFMSFTNNEENDPELQRALALSKVEQ